MTDHASFGIGCFHFGVKKKPPFKFNLSEYVKDVEAFLKAISNVSNVVISHEATTDISLDVVEAPSSVEVDTFPLISSLEIRFEVYIPVRIQEEITSKTSVFANSSTERFKVSIIHAYHCPVTFVEPINSTDEDEPSGAVMIVREFMESQNAKSGSDHIEFQCLGPSPFHSDFFIKEAKGKSDAPRGLWYKKEEREGYDSITFYFNPRYLKSMDAAKDYVFYKILEELGLFYLIVQNENARTTQWIEIQDTFDKIIELQRITGVKGLLKRYFSSSQLNEAFISIAEFEGTDLFRSKSVQTAYREIYGSDISFECIRSYSDTEIRDRSDFPTKQLLELANLFENRRVKLVESVLFIISAILGGVVGSLLTILLSRPH